MNNTFFHLQQLYQDYIAQAHTVRIKAPFAAGFFTPHKDPRLHPCHDAFYEAVGKLIARFAEQPDGDPEELLRWILEAPESHKGQEAYWYLIAAQNHARTLIPLLCDDVRKSTAIWYSQLVPRRKRYPVQEEILRLLQK